MPKVSVIIPIYSVEKYIEKCAHSLFKQTLDDIEYIFIDDCTPDHSIEIIKDVLEQYPHRKKQTRIVRMPMNSGIGAVRKHGIQLATGDYIIHCDSDDWVDVTMYENMYKKALEENLDIVFCDYYETDRFNHKKISCYSTCKKKEILSNLLYHKTAVSTWNKLIKRKIYTTNNIIYPTNDMGEDFAIILQSAIFSSSFGYINKALYFYYINANSISHDKSIVKMEKRWIDLSMNFSIVFSVLQQNGLDKDFSNEILYLKTQLKNQILSFVHLNEKYCRMWKNTFPELNFSGKGIKNKIRYLLIYFNIYPICYKIINFFLINRL